MENTHVNQNPINSGMPQNELSDIEALFEDDRNRSEKNKPKTKVNLLTKYFTPQETVEQFRILPALQGRKIIEEAYFHQVQVNNVKGKNGKSWKKIYCSAKNDPKVPKLDSEGKPILDQEGRPVLVSKRCPLCEKAKSIESTIDTSVQYIKKDNMTPAQKVIHESNNEIRKEAGKWSSKLFYIVRGIDRGKVKDGVKFWRFKHNFKNQGVYDKLLPILKIFYQEYKVSPTDVNKGCDLLINVVDSRMPNGSTFKDVSSISVKAPNKLYEDQIVVNQWLSDKSTWRDVYKEASMTRVLTSEQYLERIIKGTDPYWDDRDEDNKKYVFPDPADHQLMIKANERSNQESLDNNNSNDNQMASDLAASNVVNSSYDVNIRNVTANDVGTYQDNSIDVGHEFRPQEQPQINPNPNDPDELSQTDYDDLPF